MIERERWREKEKESIYKVIIYAAENAILLHHDEILFSSFSMKPQKEAIPVNLSSQ